MRNFQSVGMAVWVTMQRRVFFRVRFIKGSPIRQRKHEHLFHDKLTFFDKKKEYLWHYYSARLILMILNVSCTVHCSEMKLP